MDPAGYLLLSSHLYKNSFVLALISAAAAAQQHSLTNSLPLFIHFLGVVERDVVVAAGVVVCAGAGAGVVSKRYEWAIWNDWRTLHLAPRIGAVVVVGGAGHGRASDRRAADEDFYMRLNKRARPQSF